MKAFTGKHNNYRITIEEVSVKEDRELQTMQFEIEDRENMFAIVEKIKQDSGLDEQSAARLGVSIRLLGPMMMQDRKHPLFVDFMPHFRNFMQNLKKTLKGQ
ncbi:DUF3861 domain-containing protein [Vibrio splendidus]|jgi:hypothetical protein|uniref:DUF3861 domain-containing protein n=1 Tax=Vibrio splendidus TaxID=29497 RepID=A0ABD5ABS6_VIBSP|nr:MULTISPECIES: DUF3861 domain-containing protein [Vibrio]MBO7913381.1 DUF3861 domain-containing protein [Vibrio sp. G41H]MCF7492787.1 DUF3861 domain-containing protein [Vibrio sp. G-C-1]MCQ8865569.1 DUF3861 domain-containing protein [Vibrio splendidus]MDH5931988.1 DUF3861 domain-containing protein [Vibrio splendidus]MDH6019306.1 DUF3861 domain-containing protein [Vibrio splendidus]